MSVSRASFSPSVGRRRASPRRFWLMLASLGLAVLVIAWIDGGERPLRLITEEVEVPSMSRSGGQR